MIPIDVATEVGFILASEMDISAIFAEVLVIKVVDISIHRLVAVCTLDGAITTHPKLIKSIFREPSPSKLKTPAVLAFDGS